MLTRHVPALCCLSLILTLPAISATAQRPAERGAPTTHVLRSRALGEERAFQVRLPPSYSAGRSHYPVLYLTDGPVHLPHTAATVDFLARVGRIPEMIIVAIPHADRTSDLTPTPGHWLHPDGSRTPIANSGRGPQFLRFLESELIPWVEREYRTHPFRVLAGHSLGGLFASWTMAERPGLFHAAIAVSPALSWNERLVERRLRERFEQDARMNASLFLSLGDEPHMREEYDALIGLLRERAPEGFRWMELTLPDDDHGSLVLPSHQSALRFVFEGWRMPLAEDGSVPGGVGGAEAHYARLSQRLGFEVPVPEALLLLIGSQLMEQGQLTEAGEVFRLSVEKYPRSANGRFALGALLEESGDLAGAAEAYEAAVRLGRAANDSLLARYESDLKRVRNALRAGK